MRLWPIIAFLASPIYSGDRRIPKSKTGRTTSSTSSNEQSAKGLIWASSGQDDASRILQKRIIGGKDVVAGRYEYLALTFGRFLCGATLIHEDVLLTAAHCDEQGAFDDGILLGGIRIDGSDGTFHSVTETIVHEDFRGGTSPHDIMLVRISPPAVSVQPVTLAESPQWPSEGATTTVLGYGYTSPGSEGRASSIAKQVDLKVTNYEKCNNYFNGNSLTEDLQFCTGAPNSSIPADSCLGDSGGPVLSRKGKQVGIVAFGDGCAKPNVSSVNTKVGGYYKWIQANLCKLSNNPPGRCNSEAHIPQPTKAPVPQPTKAPIRKPTPVPTKEPTKSPTDRPTKSPVRASTKSPVKAPTKAPVEPPVKPTKAPVKSLIVAPTKKPTPSAPNGKPAQAPVYSTPNVPVAKPSLNATNASKEQPSAAPVKAAASIEELTEFPVKTPSDNNTESPSAGPISSSGGAFTSDETNAPSIASFAEAPSAPVQPTSASFRHGTFGSLVFSASVFLFHFI